ncbi:hypothetical protein nbrc107697_18590 [Gordonia crocea]|uniref:Uncharacterized protein n=1 Tax=Gordonia crocea TaxID=589162 RepID=A0A7I9UYD9_9ACTN|nr:hypothetical protein nbrc107697_18590 [Gordonia crocea]
MLTTVAPWAAAFGVGRSAGDDLLDELRALNMPATITDSAGGAPMTWLELARTADDWSLRLPAAGDPDGLGPGAAGRAATEAGEALVVVADETRVIVPSRDPDRAPTWTAHRVDGPIGATRTLGLGEARLILLDAIGDATAALTGLAGTSAGAADTLRADLAEHVSRFAPVFPPGADGRATEVAGLSAQVLGTLSLAADRRVGFGVALAHADEGDRRLGEVAAAARTALAAAVNHVIGDFAHR